MRIVKMLDRAKEIMLWAYVAAIAAATIYAAATAVDNDREEKPSFETTQTAR